MMKKQIEEYNKNIIKRELEQQTALLLKNQEEERRIIERQEKNKKNMKINNLRD